MNVLGVHTVIILLSDKSSDLIYFKEGTMVEP